MLLFIWYDCASDFITSSPLRWADCREWKKAEFKILRKIKHTQSVINTHKLRNLNLVCFKAAFAILSSTKVSSRRGMALRKYLNCSHEQCPKLLGSCFWELMKMERSVSQAQGFLEFEFFMVWMCVGGGEWREEKEREEEEEGKQNTVQRKSPSLPITSFLQFPFLCFSWSFLVISISFLNIMTRTAFDK